MKDKEAQSSGATMLTYTLRNPLQQISRTAALFSKLQSVNNNTYRRSYQQPPEPDTPPWQPESMEGWNEETASESEAIVKAERHETERARLNTTAREKEKDEEGKELEVKEEKWVLLHKESISSKLCQVVHSHKRP